VKSPLFFSIFTSDLQQTLNHQATILKFRSDIYKTINFDMIKSIISIKVGETGKAKDLSAPLRIRVNTTLIPVGGVPL
jgi:hypothetical protein